MKILEKQLRRDSRLFGELAEHFLRTGTPVRFRAEGASMQPNLASGDIVTVAPVNTSAVRRGNIVLTREGSGFKAHRIVSQHDGDSYVETRGDAGWGSDSADRSDILGQVSYSESGSSGLRIRHDSHFSFWRAAVRQLMHRVRVAVAMRLRNSLSLTLFAFAATTCLLLDRKSVV